MAPIFSSPVAIEIESLSKTYYKRNKSVTKAVDNLNLSVPAGQVFGFLGANGAGKTTTIKMICGLVTPTTGRVHVNGYDVAREHSMAMRQIGAVLEGTRNVYWRLTAWQNLLYFGRLKGCRGEGLKVRAEQLLRELDLWERRNDSIRTFSRGMQQKVAIACALISDPPIILLDEPTLGLDYQASRTVKEWIAKLAHDQGKTVVLTTHQLDMAQSLCDRVAIIRKGQLLADQPLKDLLHLFHQEYYEIKVKGHLSSHETRWFDGLNICAENGDTILSGAIEDQEALHGHLTKVRDLSLPLLSISRMEPNLEDVFTRLVEGSEKGESIEYSVISNLQ
ncbi:MAG TPA: ABC transporter ATP-binding protein [Ktedonobacteraceae bacterium]|nr:ABC transporter ATP-binding protein [Ktedonobacteraceae bacterium]